MNTYAYARVSARDQNLQRQITAFIEFGIEKNRIFSDKKSGKDFERGRGRRSLFHCFGLRYGYLIGECYECKKLQKMWKTF